MVIGERVYERRFPLLQTGWSLLALALAAAFLALAAASPQPQAGRDDTAPFCDEDRPSPSAPSPKAAQVIRSRTRSRNH